MLNHFKAKVNAICVIYKISFSLENVKKYYYVTQLPQRLRVILWTLSSSIHTLILDFEVYQKTESKIVKIIHNVHGCYKCMQNKLHNHCLRKKCCPGMNWICSTYNWLHKSLFTYNVNTFFVISELPLLLNPTFVFMSCFGCTTPFWSKFWIVIWLLNQCLLCF